MSSDRRSPSQNQPAAAGEETESARPLSDTRGLQALVSTRGGVVVVPVPDKARITLGRAPQCDVVIPDPSVSRLHATIVAGSPPHLEDAGSHNGTMVLGRRLAEGERAPLLLGAAIGLGQATVLLQPRAREESAREEPGSPEVVVVDPAMKRLYDTIAAIAPSPLAVLVLGETGTGKEIFARAIHDRSPRASRPFLALSCAAMPENLLEAELFGYEKGAFTGAGQAKAGLVESADGGTVFLDEIGELPAATQAKLLRVLENGEVMRLGSLRPKTVDVRFVAATNRDLQAMVAEHRFREDLFFRLAGFSVVLPPLRERRAEIRPLAELFVERAAKRANRAAPRLSAAATTALEGYAWPGNVRELRNVIERGFAFSAGGATLEPEHLVLPTAGAGGVPEEAPTLVTLPPPAPGPAPSSPGKPRSVEEEKQRVMDALQRAFGNQKEAARLLGISRRALVYKLARLGIERPRKGSGG